MAMRPAPGRAFGFGLAVPALAILLVCVRSGHGRAEEQVASYVVVGDAIVEPLDGRAGDPERGRAIVLDRAVGNCLICHRVPVLEEPFQGELGPDLTGVGGRLDPGQIRLRVVDARRVDPTSLMPSYHRVDGLRRVAPEFDGRPILNARQVEDVVAWLSGLDDGAPRTDR